MRNEMWLIMARKRYGVNMIKKKETSFQNRNSCNRRWNFWFTREEQVKWYTPDYKSIVSIETLEIPDLDQPEKQHKYITAHSFVIMSQNTHISQLCLWTKIFLALRINC